MQEIGKTVEKVKEKIADSSKQAEQKAADEEKSKAYQHVGKSLKPGESMSHQLKDAKEHYEKSSEHTKKATEYQEKAGAAAKKAEEGHA